MRIEVLEQAAEVGDAAQRFARLAHSTLKRKEQICRSHARTQEVKEGLRVEFQQLLSLLASLDPEELTGRSPGMEALAEALRDLAKAMQLWPAVGSWQSAMEAAQALRSSASGLSGALDAARQGALSKWQAAASPLLTSKNAVESPARTTAKAVPTAKGRGTAKCPPTSAQASASAAQLFPQGIAGMDGQLVTFVKHLIANRDGRHDAAIAREFTGEPMRKDKVAKSYLAIYRRLRRQGRVAF